MTSPRFIFRQAIIAGIIAGILDITAASIQFYINTGRGPVPVLKYIASGVFGKEAYSGNNIMLFWGLLFHFTIAISFSLFFFWLVSRIPQLLKFKVLTAIGYGIFMWSVTTFIIIPLSRIKPAPVQPLNALLAIAILVVCISFPLIYFSGRALKKSPVQK